jgi:hypothetical protein
MRSGNAAHKVALYLTLVRSALAPLALKALAVLAIRHPAPASTGLMALLSRPHRQWVDTAIMAVLLLRVGYEWRDGGATGDTAAAAFTLAVSLLGTAPGMTSAAAWLLMPREVWERVADRCVLLRQVGL